MLVDQVAALAPRFLEFDQARESAGVAPARTRLQREWKFAVRAVHLQRRLLLQRGGGLFKPIPFTLDQMTQDGGANKRDATEKYRDGPDDEFNDEAPSYAHPEQFGDRRRQILVG